MESHASLPTPAPRGHLLVPRLQSDERLARLAGDGNADAFAALFERYHRDVFRYCRWMVRSDADAQDALQSTFERALAALRRAQRDAPVRPWLFRIAHNESVSLLRRRRSNDGELLETLESGGPSVEEAVQRREQFELLLGDLGELTERQRSALLMRELSDLSHVEIAAALGISVGASKQTVFDARRSLVEFTEGREMECEQIKRIVSDGDGRALSGRRVRAHLRSCEGCRDFASSIAERRSTFQALSPVLPAAAATGILARVTGGGVGHAGGGASVAGATAGKAAAIAAVGTKTVTVGLVVATTAVLTVHVLGHHSRRAPASTVTRSSIHRHASEPQAAAHGRSAWRAGGGLLVRSSAQHSQTSGSLRPADGRGLARAKGHLNAAVGSHGSSGVGGTRSAAHGHGSRASMKRAIGSSRRAAHLAHRHARVSGQHAIRRREHVRHRRSRRHHRAAHRHSAGVVAGHPSSQNSTHASPRTSGQPSTGGGNPTGTTTSATPGASPNGQASGSQSTGSHSSGSQTPASQPTNGHTTSHTGAQVEGTGTAGSSSSSGHGSSGRGSH
jgi:RNA polymerase sigma factor (sigma-70 family)